MTQPPPCRSLGRQCRALRVTLHVSALDDAGLDHEATWLLGHTERMEFARLWDDGDDLYADVVIHVPCKHLQEEGRRAQCRVHGFRGPAPRAPRMPGQPRRLGPDAARLVDGGRLVRRRLATPAGSLPVLQNGDNPCLAARCTTADHTVGAACCRDLQVEIMCPETDQRTELLLRSRKAPYLCKVERDDDESLEAEILSACGYLGDDGVACSLHGRLRPDGRVAKPELCSKWPPRRTTVHPGCVLGPVRARRWRKGMEHSAGGPDPGPALCNPPGMGRLSG